MSLTSSTTSSIWTAPSSFVKSTLGRHLFPRFGCKHSLLAVIVVEGDTGSTNNHSMDHLNWCPSFSQKLPQHILSVFACHRVPFVLWNNEQNEYRFGWEGSIGISHGCHMCICLCTLFLEAPFTVAFGGLDSILLYLALNCSSLDKPVNNWVISLESSILIFFF